MESHAETLERAFAINYVVRDRDPEIRYRHAMNIYFDDESGEYTIAPDNWEVVAAFKKEAEVLAFIHGFNIAREFDEYFKNHRVDEGAL